MSKVDDELTRRFRRVERPVDVEGLFEGLERRRSHRERVRRVQTSALAVGVIAITVVGFVGLRALFDETETDIGEPGGLPGNGEIVFSKQGDDGRFHLFAANPDRSGERQITDDATNDTDPTVSPDGRTIAFVHELDRGIRVIATVPVEGGTVTWITDEELDAHDPAWSPDGSRIVYAASGIDSTWFEIVSIDAAAEGPTSVSPDQLGGQLAHPTWSPDGRSLAFASLGTGTDAGPPGSAGPQVVIGHSPSWDLETMGLGAILQIVGRGGIDKDSLISTEATTLVATERDEESPAWSPDGSRIAFTRPGDEGDEVWTIDPDTGNETLLATAVEASLEPGLAWAPDGTALLVSDGEWVYRVDASLEGDPRENFVQLFRGSSPSWRPIPAGSTHPSPEPQPSPGADAGPDGYGFGLDICPQHVTWVTAQLDGIGEDDWAFVVVERGADGACPPASPTGYLGVDVDQDRVVDMTYGPIRCEIDCLAFAAPDLDGDGRHEILLTESPGSVFRIGVYAIGAVGTPSSDTAGIVQVEVGEPDLPDAGFVTGEPARMSIGGDEGWSYRLRCVDRPEGRFLIASSAFHEVDSNGPVQISETTLAYGELRLIVVDGEERTEPFSPDPLGPQPEELCGTPIGRV